MATTLTISKLAASIMWQFDNATAWGTNTSQGSQFSFSTSLADGTAANQANRLYVDQGSIAASGSLVLDLAGSLTDVFGATITMARVKSFYIEMTGASSISIGANGAAPAPLWFGDAATDFLTVRAGGCFFIHAPDATGYALTATSADKLKILNNDGAVAAAYKIAIVGASV